VSFGIDILGRRGVIKGARGYSRIVKASCAADEVVVVVD
jgi:hypothetical protein